eukprot:COSAG05_NODE_419_length_10002_cov_97.065031_2_plen_529_part_00
MTHHLCLALQTLVDKNTQLVLAVNSIAHWASASEEKMQGLVDGGVFPALRAAFLESKFEAPHAAIGQCLSIFARHSRFRDLVGARFGFVRHAVARVLVIHQQIGLPTLDGSSQSAQQRANDVTNWDADRANMLLRLRTLHGSALQETLLAMFVLLRTCCQSPESASAAAEVPVLSLSLDFLELFRSSPGSRIDPRYSLWELNILGLLQELLKHKSTSTVLAASRPLLSRYLAVLNSAAGMSLSMSERVVCSGMLHGLWSMTSQLTVHKELIELGAVEILTRYGASAALECIAPEAWAGNENSKANMETGSGKAVALRSMRWCAQCLLNLSASATGCDAVMSAVLSCPSLWELLMVSEGDHNSINDDLVQVVLLRLFWRLYGVSLRPDQLAKNTGFGADPLAMQRAAILGSCLRSNNPEPVLFEAMQLLSGLSVPIDLSRDIAGKTNNDTEGNEKNVGSAMAVTPSLRPLGCSELVDAVVNQGDSHVAHLFVILHSPPSSRCADVALTLVFRCVRFALLVPNAYVMDVQ